MSTGKYVSMGEARGTMAYYLRADPDLRRGYKDNLAMLLHDKHGIKDVDKRNQAADDILRLIFES